MSSIRNLCICLLALCFLPSMAAAQSLEFVEAQFDGVNGVDGLSAPRFLAVSQDGAHVYVPSEGESAVAVFKRSRQDGSLTFVDAVFDNVGGVDGIAGADAVAVTRDGRHVYVGSAFEAAVAAFERDPATGLLTFVEAEFDGVGGVDGLRSTVWVSVSPDGGNVYSSGFFDNGVAVFARDRQTGEMDFLEAEIDGTGGVTGLVGPFGHAVSPDGANLYATGLRASSLVSFDRDRVTGELEYAETHFDGVDGVDGLAGARTVTVSPDGRHVYVAAFFGAAVGIFDRDVSSGRLSFAGVLREGDGGATGLFFAASATLSHDGRALYATSFAFDSVAVFRRDPATGALSFTDILFDGAAGVDGILGPLYVAASPDGRNVYVPGFQDNGVGVFSASPK